MTFNNDEDQPSMLGDETVADQPVRLRDRLARWALGDDLSLTQSEPTLATLPGTDGERVVDSWVEQLRSDRIDPTFL